VAGHQPQRDIRTLGVPLSIRPFPFRSRTRKAFVDPTAVHATCTGIPLAKISKTTPLVASVSEKPNPSTSTMIGEGLHPSSTLNLSLVGEHRGGVGAGVGMGVGVGVGGGGGPTNLPPSVVISLFTTELSHGVTLSHITPAQSVRAPSKISTFWNLFASIFVQIFRKFTNSEQIIFF
jgi:hypothetical protein